MNKPDALEKLEQAERIAYRLKNENDISAICVKSVAGKMIFERRISIPLLQVRRALSGG